MNYKVNQIAKILGVSTNTIRAYEKEGHINPIRDKSQYRLYSKCDLYKSIIVRLYIKCGFPHSEINSMFNSNTSNVKNICTDKLRELDKEIERLSYLRHWLKDSIEMFKTDEDLKNNYKIRSGMNLKYVIFSAHNKLLMEKERLEVVNYFINEIPEVRFVEIFRKNDVLNNRFIPYTGICIKDKDIERLNLDRNFIDNNPYIETLYPKTSLLSTVECAFEPYEDFPKFSNYADFISKTTEYMNKNKYSLSDDIICIYINLFGNTASQLISIGITSDN